MTERKKNIYVIAIILGVLILFFSRILFTDKIIRAPDIINEFYWGVKDIANSSFIDIFKINLHASWDMFVNSGYSVEGGDVSVSFLIWKQLIFWVIPAPASVAWFIVLQLFFGSAGLFLYCRAIGASLTAACLAGLIFALAPEMASLINAGHVMKIATISFAPWAFYFLERGFQSRKLIFFLATAVLLAFQFFNTHWQIAFYTCLSVGVYGLCRLFAVMRSSESNKKAKLKLLYLNIALLLFFITTVSISLIPLANWSKNTNRGVQSGANQGSGGLNVEEAMSWSMPPEELVTLVIPGFFGLSRQEAGANPKNINSYYWGRMRFTQTTDYMGLLPWLLAPLPLIFRRDRYSWLAVAGIVGGLLFSLGKYTPFYWALYKFFPGINNFRVPKMMMFIPVIAVAVLAARGLDLLRSAEIRQTKAFSRYLIAVYSLPILLLCILGVETMSAGYWKSLFLETLSQPTRYEQGQHLLGQRWDNIVYETGIAAGLAALYALIIFIGKKTKFVILLPSVLIIFFITDTWRINDKFLFLTAAPATVATDKESPLIKFLLTSPKTYRVLPVDGSDPMQYASHKIPVMFTPNAVQQVRWQQLLEQFSFTGPAADMLNVKYLIMLNSDYQQQKASIGTKFFPVLTTPDSDRVVLENRTVLPKAWLVSSVGVVPDFEQRLFILQDPVFPTSKVALVESPPPFAMLEPQAALALPQNVSVPVYENNRIVVDASTSQNALLVLGEKYYRGWKSTIDGKATEIIPVNHVLRGVYLAPGEHQIEFVFDPLPFKIGKWLTILSFVFFTIMLLRECFTIRKV